MRRRARLSYFIVIGIIFLCTSVKGSYRSGQSGEESMPADGRFPHLEGPVLSMDIKDEPLKKVLEHISDQSGITFLLPPSLGEEKVMIRFSNLTAEECLVKILAPYNRIFIYKEERSALQFPTRRLAEVRIFPHRYEGRVKEPVMRIAEGGAEIKGEIIAEGDAEIKGEARLTSKRKDTRESTDTYEKREKSYIEDLTTTLKGRDREAKLDAVEVLRSAGTMEALRGLSVGMRDSDPQVKNEAVSALLAIGEELKAAAEPEEETSVPESSGKDSGDTAPDDLEPEPLPQPSLSVVYTSGNSASLPLDNQGEVGGVQFDVGGTQVTEVRTTARTEGFFAQFINGRVILIPLSGGSIAPGTGPIVEIVHSGGPVKISGEKYSPPHH
jgi:hypothetical protein